MNKDKKLLKILCGHLKNKRECLGVSQEKMSEYLDISQSMISRFENGQIDSIILYHAYMSVIKWVERGEQNET